MHAAELAFLDIATLGRLYRRRDLSPVEVTRALLDRIEALNTTLNAYITVTADLAMEQARAAERDFRDGEDRGPLQGIPYNLKDLYDTAGIRTTAASRILRDFIPEEDAEVVVRLHRGGAVLLGKTNMKEFAYGQIHPDYGPARNPWNLDHTSGGSSGGSAVSVSAGMGVFSLGSDTGGSIRNPAACCGVVGMKPTFGLVSRHGMFPLSWTLDHAGPLTRTVADNAAVLAAVTGYDPKDPGSTDRGTLSFETKTAGVRGLSVGVPYRHFEAASEPVKVAIQRVVRDLASAGCVVQEVEFPSWSSAGAIFTGIVRPEASLVHERWMPDRAGDYHPVIREHLESGARALALDYLRAQRERLRFRAEFMERMARLDALVLPTMAGTAPPEDGVTDLSLTTRFTAPFNLTGQPALSMPCAFDEHGLPIGVQIAGKPFDEATVYRVASFVEASRGMTHARPPV